MTQHADNRNERRKKKPESAENRSRHTETITSRMPNVKRTISVLSLPLLSFSLILTSFEFFPYHCCERKKNTELLNEKLIGISMCAHDD